VPARPLFKAPTFSDKIEVNTFTLIDVIIYIDNKRLKYKYVIGKRKEEWDK